MRNSITEVLVGVLRIMMRGMRRNAGYMEKLAAIAIASMDRSTRFRNAADTLAMIRVLLRVVVDSATDVIIEYGLKRNKAHAIHGRVAVSFGRCALVEYRMFLAEQMSAMRRPEIRSAIMYRMMTAKDGVDDADVRSVNIPKRRGDWCIIPPSYGGT